MPLAGKVLERPELEADFVREFQLLRRLAHPGFVVPLRLMRLPRVPTGDSTPEPELVALMERAIGATLAPGKALAGDVERIAQALLQALDHLHRSGVVHGDLAPDNVLWNAEAARLTVLDLGAGGERGTRAGKTSGVLAYAAPERLEGVGLEPAGDLWSVGALLFGIVHGRHPWPGYPAARAPKPDRRGLKEHVLDGLIERLLSQEVGARHPSASAALAELESLVPALSREPERFVAPTFVDPGGRIGAAAEELTRAARGGRAASLDLSGGQGSGRSRALCEIMERLAVDGIAGVEIALREDDERAFVADALAALGRPDDEPRLATLLRAIATTGGPVALAVDDLERAPAVRQLLERVVRSLETIPEHYRGLLLVTVGLGSGPALEMPRWGADEALAALRARFPKRRVAGRDAEALVSAARGNAGLFRALVEDALEGGILRADASQVVCDVERFAAMSPPSLEARAEEALARLAPEEQRAAAVVAWCERPLALPPDGGAAAGALEPEVMRRLVAHEIAVAEPRGVRLASQALVNAARGRLAPDEAGRAAAATYEAAGIRALALAQRLDVGDAVRDEAGALLTSELPAVHGLALVEALMRGHGWPSDAASALAAAELVEEWGRPRTARALYTQARALAEGGGERARLARALLGIGRVEAAEGRYAQALAAYREALPQVNEGDAGEAALLVELHAGEARAAVLSGDLESAERAAEAGLALAGVGAEAAGLLYTRALCDRYRGLLDHAEVRLEQAPTAIREAGAGARGGQRADKEEAAIVTAQGLVAHRRGDLARAARAYGEAMRLGEAAGDESRVLTALQNLGVVQHERGEWTEALDTYREALARAEQLDARAKVAQIAGNLGNLWRYLGEAERSLHAVRRRPACNARHRRVGSPHRLTAGDTVP